MLAFAILNEALPLGRPTVLVFQPAAPRLGVQELAFWVVQLKVVNSFILTTEGVAEKLLIATASGAGGTLSSFLTEYSTAVVTLIKFEFGRITIDSISSVGIVWLSMTICICALAVLYINSSAQALIIPFSLRMFPLSYGSAHF